MHNVNTRGFASDNYSGVHPEILQAIVDANEGHQSAYGSDAYTERLQEVVREHFGPRAEAFPVFNGTGA
ncbi:beta-eliminating lyase-related protein, partial [Agrococcus casei]